VEIWLSRKFYTRPGGSQDHCGALQNISRRPLVLASIRTGLEGDWTWSCGEKSLVF